MIIQSRAGPVGGVGPRKTAQEGADGGGRLGRETEHAGGPAGAQHIGGYQRHQLVAGVGRSWDIAQVEVLLEKLGQAEVPGQGDRKCLFRVNYICRFLLPHSEMLPKL